MISIEILKASFGDRPAPKKALAMLRAHETFATLMYYARRVEGPTKDLLKALITQAEKELAVELGLTPSDMVLIMSAISESRALSGSSPIAEEKPEETPPK